MITTKPAIQYVFWDSDNTLINTAEHHWRKHLEVLKKHGITLDVKNKQRVYENNGIQNWEWISEELALKVEKQKYLEQIDAWYFNHILEVQIRDGVLDALQYCYNNKIPQCVVSNGRQRSVMSSLNAKGLTKYFKFILCAEDYEGRKPAPAPYLAALAKMSERMATDIDPQTCLAIEDDPLGVQSAKAAGMQVFHRPMGKDLPFDMLMVD